MEQQRDPQLRLGIGLHEGVPDEVYHSDPCETPSLSASLATILCERSPRHAFDAHPRLGNKASKPTTKAMDHGSMVHAAILGGRTIREIRADDYRTKKAQQERDVARDCGEIPILSKEFEALMRIAESIPKLWPIPEQHREVTLIWKAPTPEGEVLARCRIDALAFDTLTNTARIVDIKTTNDASLDRLRNSHVDLGHDIQAAANIQAVETLFPEYLGRVEFVDLYVELSTGYPQPIGFGCSMQQFGEARWARSCLSWRRCLTTGTWTAYAQSGKRVRFLDIPPWRLEREALLRLEMEASNG